MNRYEPKDSEPTNRAFGFQAIAIQTNLRRWEMEDGSDGGLIWALAGMTLVIVLIVVVYQFVRTKRKQQKLGEDGPGSNVRMPGEDRRP